MHRGREVILVVLSIGYSAGESKAKIDCIKNPALFLVEAEQDYPDIAKNVGVCRAKGQKLEIRE